MHPTTARVLAFLRSYSSEHGYAPTFREIAKGAGMESSSTASYHVLLLERAGLIRHDPNVARGIVLREVHQEIRMGHEVFG